MQRKALGKGLRALIPETEETQPPKSTDKGGPQQIPIELIEPNRLQPRDIFDSERIKELAESIREKGIIQPVIVQKKGKRYELIAGERRWRGAQLAGLSTIPVMVKEVSDRESLEIALIENIQRENLNPIEEARAYKKLIDEFELKQENLAKRVGKERSTIANTLRLLKLPPAIQDDIAYGALTMGHARAILSIESQGEQIKLRDQIIKKGLSVRAVELITQEGRKGKKKPIRKTPDVHVLQYEKKIQKILGTRTKITYNNGKGKLEIQFFSDDDLERIFEIIGG